MMSASASLGVMAFPALNESEHPNEKYSGETAALKPVF
jgi:hypothetical protein